MFLTDSANIKVLCYIHTGGWGMGIGGVNIKVL